MISDNNKRRDRERFFQTRAVRMLWPIVAPVMSRETCFPKGPNVKIMKTYGFITKEMKRRGLPMPAWWIN
jgi:hypothetical protein